MLASFCDFLSVYVTMMLKQMKRLKGTRSLPSDGPLFSLTDVNFALAGKHLLGPLSLTLPGERVVGLIGHNGSGKSTLLKLLARQLKASSGILEFAGVPLSEWSDMAFARKVSYLPQNPPPVAGMLVKELVALGRYPWHGTLGRFSAADHEIVEEAMVLTGVERFAERLVDTLSGGERQRVWLAMLVAQDAACLLLDEPISALDIAQQIEILSLINRLSRERGTGIIVVLHDVNMAARFCDEVIALHSGKLLTSGVPDRIMRPEQLLAIYDIAMDVIHHPDSGIPLCFVR